MTGDGDTDTDGEHRRAATDGGRERERDAEAVGEMDLDELRDEIRTIDREIVELIAQRTYVADAIAGVKAERGMSTTDEEQEQRVMDRAGENARRFDVDANMVKAVFRLLIELNKIEQRENR